MFKDFELLFSDGTKFSADKVTSLDFGDGLLQVRIGQGMVYMFPLCNVKQVKFVEVKNAGVSRWGL